jgi:hypothetical protein
MDGTFIEKLKEILDGNDGEIVKIADREFIKGTFTEIEPKKEFPTIDKLTFSDLKSFAEIINTEKPLLFPKGNYFVKIDSHNTVTLISDLADEKKKRNEPYEAEAIVPNQSFGRTMDYENFVIWLRSAFVANEDSENLVKLIAGIVHSDSVEMKDDGMSQSISFAKGTKSLNGEVKSIVKLRPYRTFAECEQPESEFLFRIQNNGNSFSLHEADGGKWKLTAKNNIKAYLETVIKKDNGVLILL